LTADVDGPSAGVFATYFNGGFSVDASLKVDFLRLDERFSDLLPFTANIIGGALLAPATVPFSGSGSTDLTNVTVAANLNYRFPVSTAFWIEPTVGVQYVSTNYDGDAAFLGLDDGHVLRIQGGARFGFSVYEAGATRITATLTTLAYSNVEVSGGFIAGAGFGASELLGRADEGKVRGQAIAALNIELGNGLSSFVQADVRGGDDLVGYGGRIGLRYEW